MARKALLSTHAEIQKDIKPPGCPPPRA